jgi:hypothetical protein
MDRSTHPPLAEFLTADELGLFAAFGIGDMVGVEGTEDRIVRISSGSNVVCPIHGRVLVPDACRSCRFLAGEAS